MKKLLISFSLLVTIAVSAQSDSIYMMNLEDYYRLILTNHPVAKQAASFSESAKAELRVAKGTLDPKAEVNYDSKTLNGTDYYRIWDNSLKIPVWWGTDLKLGYENNTGQNINPEGETTDAGLWYLGIQVPLGQGLFIDERRNVINQAKLLPAMAEADQIKTVNKLLLEATKDYWDWYAAYQRYQLLTEAARIAVVRLEAMKIRVLEGDLPAIDTVEALMSVQDREVLRLQAQVDYLNARLRCSTHLWNANEDPVEIGENILPVLPVSFARPITLDSLNKIVYSARLLHPDMLKLELKYEQLTIERRYQRDKLKPKAYLHYNLLTKKIDDFTNASNFDYYRNNYKVGFSFSYPIFLRQERGKLQLVDIKMRQNNWERQQRSREIGIEIEMAYANWLVLETQIATQEKQVRNAFILRDGEQERFDTGESSFFLVNAREMTLINNQIRLVELQARSGKNKAQLYWSAGIPIAGL
jgi:outer membrane protein TolC